jgi:hypothetical protein
VVAVEVMQYADHSYLHLFSPWLFIAHLGPATVKCKSKERAAEYCYKLNGVTFLAQGLLFWRWLRLGNDDFSWGGGQPYSSPPFSHHVHATADILSDPKSRALYDSYGKQGMQGREGAGAGVGNARDAWEEFKPYVRQNKHTRARQASR